MLVYFSVAYFNYFYCCVLSDLVLYYPISLSVMQFVLFVKLGPTSSPIFVLSHLFHYLSRKSVIHECCG